MNKWTLKVLVWGQTSTAARHCVLGALIVSLRQFDSLVLLWIVCDKEAQHAVCEPPFDYLHQIMHFNHNLTNLLGIPIDKTPALNVPC